MGTGCVDAWDMNTQAPSHVRTNAVACIRAALMWAHAIPILAASGVGQGDRPHDAGQRLRMRLGMMANHPDGHPDRAENITQTHHDLRRRRANHAMANHATE